MKDDEMFFYSRSSHRRCSAKKGVLKNDANFTGKHLCWSLFLIKFHVFRPATFLKRYCNMDVFLWNLWIFKEHLFPGTSANTALHFLCKPCLEKLPKGLCKICQLYVRIPYNSYFGKCIKRWSQWFQGKHLILKVPL